jgi:type I restriction enzyme S subunit
VSFLKPLGEVADVVRGIAFPKEDKSYVQRPGDVACLRTSNVQKQVEWNDLWYVPAKHVKRDDQNVRTGDILISTANSYELVGKVAQVAGLLTPATLGAFISLIRPKDGIHPKFLYHQLAWGKTQTRIREMSSNTTNISNVSTKKLATLELVVPDLDEQTLIVAELEKQFSRLDEAVANLQRVKANLKRYKAAVLKDAVEGRLVPTEAELARREGRSFESGEQLLRRILAARRDLWSGRGKYVEPDWSMPDGLPSLPDGWAWAPFGVMGKDPFNTVQTGPFGAQLHNTDFTPSGVPVIAVGNLTGTGFKREGLYFISQAKADQLARYDVFAGDILFARSGATLGKVCVAPVDVVNWRMTGHILRARLNIDFLRPEIALYALAALPTVTKQIFGSVRGVTRPGFNTSLLESIWIPIPPPVEQQRIVAEVDSRLSLLAGVEAQVDANLKRARALWQSALSKAFSL